MRSRRPKSLLLALWLAVQLVLGPVTGATPSGWADDEAHLRSYGYE